MTAGPASGWFDSLTRIDRWTPRQWLLFWFGWSLLISAIYWILGPHSYLRIQDNADFNVPYRIAAARDLLEHGVTWWQPKFSGGMPSWVHPQIDSFLVNGPPYLLLPAWAVYGLLMWLQRFLAGYFTFRLCREALKIDPVGALFAGLAFSLFLWSVQDWKLVAGLGYPALGLTLLFFWRLLDQSLHLALPGAFLLGAVITMTAPTVLYVAFLLPALPLWFVIVHQSGWRELLPRFAAFTGGVLIAGAPSLTALLTYSPVTTRGQMAAQGGTQPPGEAVLEAWRFIIERLLPEHALYLAVFVLGLLLSRGLQRGAAWRLLAVFLLAGLGSELLRLAQVLSGDLFPPSRGNLRDINQFSTFTGPLLGGVGLHLLWRGRARLDGWRRTAVTGVTVAVLALPLFNTLEVTRLLMHRLSTDNYAVNFDNPLLRDLGQRREGFPFRVATVGTWMPTVASASGNRLYPTYVHAYNLESADGYYRLHSARYHRYWLRVIDQALAAYPQLREKVFKWYYLFKAPEARFADRTPLVLDDWYNVNLLSLANTRYLLSHWPLDHPGLQTLQAPTRELAAGRVWEGLRLRQKIVRTIQGDTPDHAIYLYENTSVLPRAFLVENLRVFAGADALLDALAAAPLAMLRDTAFVEAGDLPDARSRQGAFVPGRVTFDRYSPDHLALTTESDGPGFLVLTNNHDPYWTVRINDRAATLIPVDHTFQGLILPPGRNRVVLDYWPPYRPGQPPSSAP